MLLLLVISCIYVVTISVLIYGFTKTNQFEPSTIKPTTAFTIIVPFRNEAKNLSFLLESLSQLNYPSHLFQVILVDDASSDGFQISGLPFTTTIINNNRVSNSPKKDAIVTAMNTVTTEWIITTDADCTTNKTWLLTLDNYIQTHDARMIAGAVTYDCQNTFLHQFQQLDLASLQGATIGSFGIRKGFMCNGANLAYTKTLFQELNGFNGNDTIASGDDVFLLQKAIAQFPKQVHYLKSKHNIITTKPLNEWKPLFHQRVRWASKTSSYQSSFGKFLGVVVLVGNLGWILTLGCWIFRLIPIEFAIILSLLKFAIDGFLIFKTNTFLRQKTQKLILGCLLYPFFSVCVALYSFFGNYEWKDRTFSK